MSLASSKSMSYMSYQGKWSEYDVLECKAIILPNPISYKLLYYVVESTETPFAKKSFTDVVGLYITMVSALFKAKHNSRMLIFCLFCWFYCFLL